MSSHAPRAVGRNAILGAALVILAIEAAAALTGRSGTVAVGDGLHQLVRITARTSATWFVLAFVARPLTVLRAAPGKWLLRHRRYLGLAMAISHAGHLAAIVALARHEGTVFWDRLAITTLVGGGFGYVILAAMVATSFDGAQAWLGRRRWRALHLTGMWTFWIIFAASYAPRILHSATSAVATATLLAAAAVRVIAAVRARRGRRATCSACG
jgi:hypothetical protein